MMPVLDDCPQCRPALSLLTSRQLEVVRLVARGATNQAVADQLGVSINTVKKSLKLSFVALDVATRTELAARFGHCLLR
jgi:DNA-binding NarL/FixJ family response regulator